MVVGIRPLLTLLLFNFFKEASLTAPKLYQDESNTSLRQKPHKYVDVSTLDQDHPQKYSSALEHNLPECAINQVCNAVFVRMNHTQNLCDCSKFYNYQCSTETSAADGHTIELTKRSDRKVYTLVKLCEPVTAIKTCSGPTAWTLLALQSERSGKAHYVVVCNCPKWAKLEGPYTHNRPPYARIPGIRVYGMLCATSNRQVKSMKKEKGEEEKPSEDGKDSVHKGKDRARGLPEFPWDKAYSILNSLSSKTLL